MHLHLPKPLHGWREFAGEVGIIVIGVLIALGAEQGVQAIHHRYLPARRKTASARSWRTIPPSRPSASRSAIACASFTDLRQRLIASGDNWSGLQGKPLSGAAKASNAGALFATAPPLGAPQDLWPVSAWTAATTSGALGNARHRFFRYAALYAMVATLDRLQEQETADYSKLMPFDMPLKLDPSARLQLLGDLGSIDSDNANIERLAAVFVTAARRNGIAPDPGWLAAGVGREARSRGACVKQGPRLDAALASEFNLGAPPPNSALRNA